MFSHCKGCGAVVDGTRCDACLAILQLNASLDDLIHEQSTHDIFMCECAACSERREEVQSDATVDFSI